MELPTKKNVYQNTPNRLPKCPLPTCAFCPKYGKRLNNFCKKEVEMHKNFFDKKPQFELKPILNTFLACRVWYIIRNLELNISNTQPELKKRVVYKSVYL